MTINPSLAIVVPCYNEEEALKHTFTSLDELYSRMRHEDLIHQSSKIYYIDDGSSDKTWEMLKQKSKDCEHVIAIHLSINKGHQNALYAGMCSTTEDMIVSIDADLQDDINCIVTMVEKFKEGHEVVYGVRSERTTDSWFKRVSAEGYYTLMQKLGVNLIFNHADYRLISKRVLDALKEYTETNLFLRGIIPSLGFKSCTVEYARDKRIAGESKYPLRKMLSFAWEGISSFSTAPLRSITVLGFLSGCVSLFTLFWVLAVRIFTDMAIPGWASILLPLLFIGSVQLISLGILGEYLSKIYIEVKRRPKYHIEDISK